MGFVLCFGGVFTLLRLIRTLMTRPTLVVNADGIVDNCSIVISGRGLLHWNETLVVEEFVSSSSKPITYRFLDIDIMDRRAITRRQPLWKRVLAIVASQRQPRASASRACCSTAHLQRWSRRSNRYINIHVPEGNWHKAMTDDKAERPNEE